MRDCLTCKYEPEWGPERAWGDFTEKEGLCTWSADKPIPSSYQHHNVTIICFNDEAGIYTDCPAWEPKDV